MKWTKQELLIILITKDQEGFKRFYTEYEPFLFGIGQRYGLNELEAEEVLLLFLRELWHQPVMLKSSKEKHLSVFLVKRIIDTLKAYIRS